MLKMVKLMGDGLFERYARLWHRYGIKKFSFDDIKLTIKEENDVLVNVIMHRLKNEGVLITTKRTNDKRIKIYHIISPVLWVQRKLKEVK